MYEIGFYIFLSCRVQRADLLLGARVTGTLCHNHFPQSRTNCLGISSTTHPLFKLPLSNSPTMARRTASNGSAPTPSHQSQPSQSVSPRQQRAQRHRSQPSQSGSSSNPQSNTQNQHNQAAQPEQQQQQPQQQQQQQPQQPQRPLQLQQEPRDFGMSPHHRYDHNMKVLRRRDSSIVSIFDQFSHVCVYHHNGEKWEKQGFEGSMFLYERCVRKRFLEKPVFFSMLSTGVLEMRILPMGSTFSTAWAWVTISSGSTLKTTSRRGETTSCSAHIQTSPNNA